MSRALRAIMALALALAFLPLGGCMEEIVISVEAEGDMSVIFCDSGDAYVFGAESPAFYLPSETEARDVTAPEKFTMLKGPIDVATGEKFAVWLTVDGMFMVGDERYVPHSPGTMLSSKKIERPAKIMYSGAENTIPAGDLSYDVVLIDVDLSDVTQVEASRNMIFVLKKDGTVYSWGNDPLGWIPNPLSVGDLTGIAQIAVSNNEKYLAALDMNGNIWTWNLHVVPSRLNGASNMIQVVCTNNEYVALDTEGKVWTWSYETEPVADETLPRIMNIVAGLDFHAAVDADGNVWTRGANDSCQLGRDTGGEASDEFAKVEGITGVIAMNAGYRHMIVIRKDGTVWAWGSNSSGQLGNGATDDSLKPVQLPSLTTRVNLR